MDDNQLSLYAIIRNRVLKRVQDRLTRMTYVEDKEVLHIVEQEIMDDRESITLSIGLRNKLRKEIFNRIRRLDVLQELLDDDSITEIMVNGIDEIYIERNGRIIASGLYFESKERLMDIVGKIASGVNRTINMRSPILDARLDDGSRVNIVLDPVALNGPILTIRRFPKVPVDANRLVELGSITKELLGFIEMLVKAKYNILISGANRIIGLSQMTFRKQRVQTT